MGLAVCTRSPAPILRVANTPRPADSVSATRIGGGRVSTGRPGFSFSAGPSAVVEKKDEVRASFFWRQT